MKVRKKKRKTKIYGKCLRIEAIKTSGPYKGQSFYHDFERKLPNIYGLPNGDVLISSR